MVLNYIRIKQGYYCKSDVELSTTQVKRLYGKPNVETATFNPPELRGVMCSGGNLNFGIVDVWGP